MRKLRVLLALVFALGGASVGATATQAGTGNYETVRSVIYKVWPAKYAGEAMGVIGCETGHTYSVYARSKGGTYLGLFQQDSKHRARWGFAFDVWVQAKSNWRAFQANGYCWSCNQQWPACGAPYD